MYKLDPHIHSIYSGDSNTSIEDIIRTAEKKGLDIIAISDHNTVEGSKIARTLGLNDVLIVPSIEISSSEGHILGFGCEELIEKGLTPAETIDRIHEQGGLAIVPHPFCFYRHGLLDKTDERLEYDGIETKNARFILGYCNSKAKKLSMKNSIPALGSSDAHYKEFIGDCYTKIDCEKDIDSVLKAIKKNKVAPAGKGTSNIQLAKYLFDKNVLKKK
ncbi:MAG: PHP domain-containing protein [Methanobrevibacter sp.]|uniref:CehA/McbA family metallohydrolase n=1 Tax=Methanobrevibacter sp. TaxID=66852 RepID=UPI0026E056CE|nr:PHP domain-containing protein [Methanobrevibacter sp.]MDO5849549.1 PHP domain-containing protein [Methanobrevibacter sp.]